LNWISCIMPTADRRTFVPEAIRLFLAQDYPQRELVIFDDGADPVVDLVPHDERIRYIRRESRLSIGAKRNLACDAARGEIIAHWDDDDWYAPWRLSRQVAEFADGRADLCGLDRVPFVDPSARRAWEYVYPADAAPWVYGATLCYRKALWRDRPFPEIGVGEDTGFVAQVPPGRVRALAAPGLFVGLVHRGNTSPKRTHEPWWRPLPYERIAEMVGGNWAAMPGAEIVPVPAPAAGRYATPRVCIGIHVHSQPERLHQTLAHLRAHGPVEAEMLLLGDGPDEPTRQALAQLAAFPQSTTEQPSGAAACFNRLIGRNDAQIVVFVESGSLVGPGWFEPIVAALEADQRNGLAGPTTNLAWGRQGSLRGRPASAANVADLAKETWAQFGMEWQTLEPLYCLADFCYAVRRDVIAANGAADEGYGLGPCWEMDYTVRAVRSGFRPVWARGAYVFRHPFSPRRSAEEARLFEVSKRRYQDRFCGLKLSGERPGYAAHCHGEECAHFAPAARISRRIALPAPAPEAAPAEPPRPAPASAASPAPPMVTCIMPTADRREWVRQSVGYFERQNYPARELIVVDDGNDDLAAILPRDPRIRLIRSERSLSIGAKRNLACEAARGTLIAHWDDDDWYAPDRLTVQAAPLLAGTAEISAFDDTLFFDLDRWRFWRCSREVYARLFVGGVHGGTLMYKRSVFGRLVRYPDLSLAEDALFLRASVRCGARVAPIGGAASFAYVRHATNAWRFVCGEAYGISGWRRCGEPAGFAVDRDFYVRRSRSAIGDRTAATAAAAFATGFVDG
jgi:glycosyltransferase involved in cell wall biosynthesis